MENNKPEVTAIDILTMHSGLLPETIKASYSWVLSAMNEYGSRKVLEYQQSQPADESPSGSEAWVSVEDRLPEDINNVLAYNPEMKSEDTRVEVAFYDIVMGWTGCPSFFGHGITHWMKLPSPPQTK